MALVKVFTVENENMIVPGMTVCCVARLSVFWEKVRCEV